MPWLNYEYLDKTGVSAALVHVMMALKKAAKTKIALTYMYERPADGPVK